jgi:hypothetical protein
MSQDSEEKLKDDLGSGGSTVQERINHPSTGSVVRCTFWCSAIGISSSCIWYSINSFTSSIQSFSVFVFVVSRPPGQTYS